MIVLPSIAFGGFSGSAKDVTARQVHGRTILGIRTWPTGPVTNAQVVRRVALGRITKSYKNLTADQMAAWEKLAEHSAGASVFGQKAELSGINLYVRLNANRAMAGEPLLTTAPEARTSVPNVSYSQITVTPNLVVFTGIHHEPAPFKIVVKMSGSQSAGISNGWSKTVIISPEVEDDWGEADVTKLYLKTIGVEPTPGQKVFIESYWMDTSTGFTGQVYKDCVVVTGEASNQGRLRVTMDSLSHDKESHVANLEVDFSTGSPVAVFNAICKGRPGSASSVAYLNEKLPKEVTGNGMCLCRSCDAKGHINVQSALVYISTRQGKTEMTFAHRGGPYYAPCEAFGAGIIYE